MGLVIVQLVMTVEEEFGISLPDEDVNQMSTVGDMHGYIMGRLQQAQGKPCMSSHVFYRLRRALTDTLGVPRQSITPQTPVQSILGMSSNRENWTDLEKRVGLVLPSMEHSRRVHMLIWGIAVAMTVFGYAAIFQGHVGWFALAILIGLPIYFYAAYKLAYPFARVIPASNASVGVLARKIMCENHQQLESEFSDTRWKPDSDAVWDRLKAVIVETAGVKPEDVTHSARFIEDLGLD